MTAKRIGADAQCLRVGMGYCMDQAEIAAVIGEFHARHHDVHVETRMMSAPIQLAALLHGQLDVGFVRPLVPAAARKFRRGPVVYRMLEPAPDNIETAIAWRRADKSPMLAEFVGAARRTLSRRTH